MQQTCIHHAVKQLAALCMSGISLWLSVRHLLVDSIILGIHRLASYMQQDLLFLHL